MVGRAAIAGALAMSALLLAGGGGATPTAQALARPGIVSLDLRTHKQRVFPLGDLAALSPEGRRVAFGENPDNKECLLHVCRLDGSHDRVLVRTAFPLCPGDPRWSPDGRTIAYSLFTKCNPGGAGYHPVELWVVRSSGGPPRLLSNDAGTVAWAPKSRRLAFPGELDGAGRSRLTVESLDGASRAAFGSRVEIYSLSWSADGRRVLYSTNSPWFAARGSGEIHAVSAATGAGAVLARGVDPAWSRDGKFLSFVSRKGARTTLFLQRHGTRRVVLSRPNFGFVHAWSPTGHLLAFAATNRYGQGRVFVFDPGRAKPLRAVTRWAYGPVASIVWSRDGRRILFARTTG
jgi:Tol biopolymer transport system component